MLLLEIHELLPAKLFSKRLADVINKMLEKVDALGPSIADVSIRGQYPTVLSFVTLGGEVEGGAKDPEVREYLKTLRTLLKQSFGSANIQAPKVEVKYGTDMAGEAEISVTCTWDWLEPRPQLDAQVLLATIDEIFEPEVKL